MSDLNAAIGRAMRNVQLSRDVGSVVPTLLPKVVEEEEEGVAEVLALQVLSTSVEPLKQIEKLDPRTCVVCAKIVKPHHDRSIRGACHHVTHTSCLAELIRAGRQYCTKCGNPAQTHTEAKLSGGYTVDSSNDTDIRFALANALEYEREKVRARLVTGIIGFITKKTHII